MIWGDYLWLKRSAITWDRIQQTSHSTAGDKYVHTHGHSICWYPNYRLVVLHGYCRRAKPTPVEYDDPKIITHCLSSEWP